MARILEQQSCASAQGLGLHTATMSTILVVEGFTNCIVHPVGADVVNLPYRLMEQLVEGSIIAHLH